MLGVDNTSEVLYHYLRALHVKVSTMTVHRLLDTPLGNSMRDISDALDSLHVSNAAYQLPKEYLDELEAPCIVIMNDNDSPFCLIEKIEENAYHPISQPTPESKQTAILTEMDRHCISGRSDGKYYSGEKLQAERYSNVDSTPPTFVSRYHCYFTDTIQHKAQLLNRNITLFSYIMHRASYIFRNII